IFEPAHKARGQVRLQEIMSQTKRELEHALPFAMAPVVYDFAINARGTWAELLTGEAARMPASYETLTSSVHTRLSEQNPTAPSDSPKGPSLTTLLQQFGFDRAQHEQIRADLKSGLIGLAQNRLRAHTQIEDVLPSDVVDTTGWSRA